MKNETWKGIIIATAILELVVLSILLGGCQSVRYVEVEKVHTDTLYISKTQKDSIYLHDSIFVNQWQSGDTIFQVRDRWHTEWRDRLVTDTVLHFVTDTVPKPYPVIQEKKVEKELNWWQRLRLTVGDIALFALALMVVVWGVRAVILKLVRP